MSAVALLMLVAGSHGTASTTVSGFVSVVVLPPASLLAGIGLLRRRAWAYYFLVGLFGITLAVGLSDYWQANPEPYRYLSPSGVPTTVLATDRTLFVAAIVVSLGMLAVLLPEWARHRRDEIVARIKREFREPDYEYSRAGGVPSATATGSLRPRHGSRLAATAAAAILLAIAGAMSWLVHEGVGTGTTVLPSTSAVQRRPVSRTNEPITFWVAIALYASVAGGCVGLVGWGIAQTRKP